MKPAVVLALHHLLGRVCAAVAVWGCFGLAQAQEAVQEVTPALDLASPDNIDAPTRGWSGFGSIGGLQLVEVSPGLPGQRPRRALRMRFDSATRAMRTLGLDAQDCTSLVRSNSGTYRPDPASGDRLKLNLSLALNCKFF
ncbi:MAG TPA: hypothetical protein VF169_14265 [Albitalea sp.]|uniref:hypothetical protein n=1 Tax=Piscinibacter sp. TaxID=1903157 RepID=UPI002ED54572